MKMHTLEFGGNIKNWMVRNLLFSLFLLGFSFLSAQYEGLKMDYVVGYKAQPNGNWQRIGEQSVDDSSFLDKTFEVGSLNYHPAFYIDQSSAFSWYGWYGYSDHQSLFAAYALESPSIESVVWSMENSEGAKLVQTTDRNLELGNPRLDLIQDERSAQLITYVHHKKSNSTQAPNYALHLGHGAKWASKTINPLKGWVGEILQINHSISDVQRLKLETYLAIKYGFTIDSESLGYINSKDEVLLNPNTDGEYYHRIFSLAKDSSLGLDQRQSQSSNLPGVLSIALGKHELTHAENPNALDELTYLFVGDDDKLLTAEAKPVNQKWQTGRTWRITTTKAINQALEFKVNLDSLFTQAQQEEKPNVYLVYEGATKTYIPAESTKEGVATFVLPQSPKADAYFRFALAGDYFVDFTPSIEECSKEKGKIDFKAYGLKAPLKIEIEQVGVENSLKTLTFRTEEGSIENLAQGLYKIKITDTNDKIVEDEVAVNPKDSPIEGQLKTFYFLKPGYPVDVTLPEGYKYEWRLDGKKVSTKNTFAIEKSGNYTLSVTSDKGCQWTYGFQASREETPAEPNTELYPNPSKGDYKLSITLPEGSQEKAVSIKVYDVNGRLISEKMLDGDVAYRLEGYIPTVGIYYIHVIWNGETFSHKLLVSP